MLYNCIYSHGEPQEGVKRGNWEIANGVLWGFGYYSVKMSLPCCKQIVGHTIYILYVITVLKDPLCIHFLFNHHHHHHHNYHHHHHHRHHLEVSLISILLEIKVLNSYGTPEII